MKANYKFSIKMNDLSNDTNRKWGKNILKIIWVYDAKQQTFYLLMRNVQSVLLETKKKRNETKKKTKKVFFVTFFLFFAFDFKYNLKNHHLLSDDDVFGEVFA